MTEEWLFPNAVVPVDAETTAALVAEIHRLIGVVGGMALAQPVQEPVFLLQSHSDGYWCVDLTCKKCYSADFRFKHKSSVDKESLTTPTQRTWVGLTHEEHMELMTGTMTTSSRMAAVEAKLKEKNFD